MSSGNRIFFEIFFISGTFVSFFRGALPDFVKINREVGPVPFCGRPPTTRFNDASGDPTAPKAATRSGRLKEAGTRRRVQGGGPAGSGAEPEAADGSGRIEGGAARADGAGPVALPGPGQKPEAATRRGALKEARHAPTGAGGGPAGSGAEPRGGGREADANERPVVG